MLIERGVQVGDIRLRLIIQSADVETHSVMSDNVEVFNTFSDQLREECDKLLRGLVASTVILERRR